MSASVLGAGMALPQARRLLRTGNVDGVSAVWIGVSLTINAWWTAYAIAASVWGLLPVAVTSMVLYGAMGVVYLRAAGGARPMAAGAFGLGMAPLPFLLAGGWAAAGVATGLSYGIQLAPAVVAAYRTRELQGVSLGTWVISFVEALLWLAYGALLADAALVAGGVTGTVMAGAILLRLAAVGSAARLIRVDDATRVNVARN